MNNPIHLHPWLAGLFGFNRHIAHGMWSKAKCLSGLADQLDKAFVVNVDFKKPIFLPAQVMFSLHVAPAEVSNHYQSLIEFQLSSSEGQTTHLVGQL